MARIAVRELGAQHDGQGVADDKRVAALAVGPDVVHESLRLSAQPAGQIPPT
jgi:hypothetical protein